MTAIKGQKYQLAGFDIEQRGSLVNVFAKFCGVGQDPANLPETTPCKMFANSIVQDMPVIYPRLSGRDIVDTLIGPDDTAKQTVSALRLPHDAQDLLADLGADQFARVLVEMGKAKTSWLNRTPEPVIAFVPYKPA